MEDLADLRIWRGALNDGEIHAGVAEALGTYVARLAFHTSDLGMDPEERKRQLARTINPELCRITEDLVLTEPLREHEHNWHLPQLETQVRALRADQAALDALATPEAPLHDPWRGAHPWRPALRQRHGRRRADRGHRSRVRVLRAGGLRPRCRSGPTPSSRRSGHPCLAPGGLPGARGSDRARVLGGFLAELRRLWPERVDTSFSEATLSALARTSWDDALGFAAAKMIRRMIGFAHVSDIETLDEAERVVAVGAVLRDRASTAGRPGRPGRPGRAVGRGRRESAGRSLRRLAAVDDRWMTRPARARGVWCRSWTTAAGPTGHRGRIRAHGGRPQQAVHDRADASRTRPHGWSSGPRSTRPSLTHGPRTHPTSIHPRHPHHDGDDGMRRYLPDNEEQGAPM